MSPRSSTTTTPNNSILIFVVAALFMIFLAVAAMMYIGDNFNQIQTNQQKNSQKSLNQRKDLTSIECSMWHTMTTSPNVHPDPTVKKQMDNLCGP